MSDQRSKVGNSHDERFRTDDCTSMHPVRRRPIPIATDITKSGAKKSDDFGNPNDQTIAAAMQITPSVSFQCFKYSI